MHFLLFCLSVCWSIHLHAETELVDRNLTKMPLWASSSVSAALLVFVISVAPSFLVQTEAGCSCSTAPPKVKGLAIHPCGWNSKRKILLLFSSSIMSDSATPWTAACQASLSFTISRSLLKVTFIELVMPPISSSIVPFSSCLQSFPASGSFPVSQLFPSGGQSIGASASASVLLMNIQGWFPQTLLWPRWEWQDNWERRLGPAQTPYYYCLFFKSGNLPDHRQKGSLEVKGLWCEEMLYPEASLVESFWVKRFECTHARSLRYTKYGLWTKANQNDWPKKNHKKRPIEDIQIAIGFHSEILSLPVCLSTHTILFFLSQNTCFITFCLCGNSFLQSQKATALVTDHWSSG